MLFIGIQNYPGKSSKVGIKKALEVVATNPPPDYIKRTYYVTVEGENITVYGLYDIEDGKVNEGMKELMKRAIEVIQAAEGLGITFKAAYPLEEALQLVNLD